MSAKKLRKPLRKKSPEKEDYPVDAKLLKKLVIEHSDKRKEADVSGQSPSKVPPELGELLYNLVHRLSLRFNFRGYDYIDDMRGDALLLILSKGLTNYDPDKGTSPFSYFTQLAWSAFTDRIKLEKRNLYRRNKATIDYLDEGRLSNPLLIHSHPLEGTIRESVESYEQSLRKQASLPSKPVKPKIRRSKEAGSIMAIFDEMFPEDELEGS